MFILLAQAQTSGDGSGGLWLSAVVGVLAALGGSVGAWLLSVYKNRHEQQRQQRHDALAEWQQIADRLQARADTQEQQLYKLHQEHAECERGRSELAADVRVLTIQVQTLQDRLSQTVASVKASVDQSVKEAVQQVADQQQADQHQARGPDQRKER